MNPHLRPAGLNDTKSGPCLGEGRGIECRPPLFVSIQCVPGGAVFLNASPRFQRQFVGMDATKEEVGLNDSMRSLQRSIRQSRDIADLLLLLRCCWVGFRPGRFPHQLRFGRSGAVFTGNVIQQCGLANSWLSPQQQDAAAALSSVGDQAPQHR